ncbi:MAG: 1-(5-phosphoribosyl)-5-[(5-phosphoribosylamino)methylideneamino]imidazole-4-carboxamide isomerase [Candidatus Bathyarchaeia archaeon]
MEIYPAVDLMNGRCVRLVKGRRTARKTYYRNPVEAASKFAELGASRLHVVDLDAAMGVGENVREMTEIIRQVNVKVQVAGGIRSVEKAQSLLEMGAFRVVFSTAAVENPGLLEEAVAILGPEKIALALDLKKGDVMVHGWRKRALRGPKQLIDQANRLSLGAVIFTSISVDGTLQGVDLQTAQRVRSVVKTPLIVAGGISSVAELKRLEDLGVDGAIVGKALYEGAIDLRKAISKLRDC